jgi:hypothetical protein
MLSTRFKAVAAALAATAAFLCVGSHANAQDALQVTVTVGGTTETFYSTDDTHLETVSFTFGGYTGDIDTEVTNFPGAVDGHITTTINLSTVASGSADMTVKTEVIQALGYVPVGAGNGTTSATALGATDTTNVNAQPVGTWTSPSGSPVHVFAGFSTSSPADSGTGNAETVFDSPPTSSRPGTGVINSGNVALTAVGALSGTTDRPSTGTYSLAQIVTLSGASTSSGMVVDATSRVTSAVPEPSTMALAGLGALGFVSFALRRRKALGD